MPVETVINKADARKETLTGTVQWPIGQSSTCATRSDLAFFLCYADVLSTADRLDARCWSGSMCSG